MILVFNYLAAHSHLLVPLMFICAITIWCDIVLKDTIVLFKEHTSKPKL